MPGLDPVLLAVYSELEGTELVEVTIMMMMIKMMIKDDDDYDDDVRDDKNDANGSLQ